MFWKFPEMQSFLVVLLFQYTTQMTIAIDNNSDRLGINNQEDRIGSADRVNALVRRGKADNTTIVTASVKFYYTKEQANKYTDIQLYFERIIAVQNQIMMNSEIPLRFKMFCFEELADSEAVKSKYKIPEQEKKGGLKGFRGSADLQVLIYSDGCRGGAFANGWKNGKAIQVIHGCLGTGYGNIVGLWVAHEAGHNIVGAIGGNSHGGNFKLPNKKNVGTIMLGVFKFGPYFSNPDVFIPEGYPGYSEEGTPMGTEVKDMAKYWRERRFALADIGDESWGCKASGVNGADFERPTKLTLTRNSACKSKGKVAVKLLDESNGQTCTITVGNSPKPEELRGNNDSEDDSGIETEDEREVEEEETDEVDDREGDVKEEGSITTVYVKDLRDDCTRTAFPNGISKVEINDFKDDWCLEQVEIELADGEKYGCSGEGDIESCTPEKLQDAVFEETPKPNVMKIATRAGYDCGMQSGGISIAISGPNGEYCGPFDVAASGSSLNAGGEDQLVASQMGDCTARKFSDGISRFLFKHSGDDDWCFGGAEVELDNGDQYGCSEEEFSLVDDEIGTCIPVKLAAAKTQVVKISSECGTASDISAVLTFALGDSCETPILAELSDFSIELSGANLGDCATKMFSRRLSNIEIKSAESGDWCFGGVDVVMDNEDSYTCARGDETSTTADGKIVTNCQPTQDYAVKIRHALVSAGSDCSKKSQGKKSLQSFKVVFSNDASCTFPANVDNGRNWPNGKGIKQYRSGHYARWNFGDCAKEFSSKYEVSSIIAIHAGEEEWCFGGITVEMTNGNKYQCAGLNLKLNGDVQESCRPVLLQTVQPVSLDITTSNKNKDCGMNEYSTDPSSLTPATAPGLNVILKFKSATCKIFNLNNGFIQSGSTISLTSSQLGKCLDLKDNGDLRQIEFEHRGDDNWCFGGVVVTLDNGEKYSCEEDDYPFSINYMKSSTCRPTKVMPEVLELSTNDCDINGDLSVTLSSSEGDCTTVLENTLVAGSTNSIYELGDCATSGFIDGVSKIQLKQAGIDDLCFGKMIVKLTNGKQYSCSSGWSKNGDTIECNPVKRDIVEIQEVRMNTKNEEGCYFQKSPNNYLSFKLLLPNEESCDIPSLKKMRIGTNTVGKSMLDSADIPCSSKDILRSDTKRIQVSLTGVGKWCSEKIEIEDDEGNVYECTEEMTVQVQNESKKQEAINLGVKVCELSLKD